MNVDKASMKSLMIILFVFSFSVFAQESYLSFDNAQRSQVYVVKAGDTLSKILNDHGFTGVYENREENRHLNPIWLVMWKNGLREEDLKNLEPGQQLYLPIKPDGTRSIASESTDGAVEDIPFQEVKRKVEEYASEENSFF